MMKAQKRTTYSSTSRLLSVKMLEYVRFHVSIFCLTAVGIRLCLSSRGEGHITLPYLADEVLVDKAVEDAFSSVA